MEHSTIKGYFILVILIFACIMIFCQCGCLADLIGNNLLLACVFFSKVTPIVFESPLVFLMDIREEVSRSIPVCDYVSLLSYTLTDSDNK